MAKFFEDFVFDGKQVPILWEKNDPYFRATEIGNIFGIKNIHTSIEKFSEYEKSLRKIVTPGGPQEATFLTEQGLYKLIFKSRKTVAHKFQMWVFDVIKNIRKNGMYELKDLKETIENYKNKEKSVNHDTWIEAFDKKYCVYIGYIDEIDGKKLLKIGSTKQLKTRAKTLAEEFGSMNIIHVCECDANEKFEKYLHNHKKISPHHYKKPINNRQSSEVFLMDKETEERLYRIIKASKYKFQIKKTDEEDGESSEEDETLVQTHKLMNTLTEEIQHLQQVSEGEIRRKAQEAEELVIKRKAQAYRTIADDRNHTQGRGSKVQIYNPETFELVHTFPGELDATRHSEYFDKAEQLSVSRIKHAIENKTIYKKYRWMFLARDFPNDYVQKMEPTQESKSIPNNGLVAMIDLNKSNIMKVFMDQKDASADRKFKNGAAICKAIHQGTQSGGFYWKMWATESCEKFPNFDEMKETYLQKNTLPEPRVSNGIQINCLDPETKAVVKTYNKIQSIVREHKLSRETLKKAIHNQTLLRGFYWKETV